MAGELREGASGGEGHPAQAAGGRWKRALAANNLLRFLTGEPSDLLRFLTGRAFGQPRAPISEGGSVV